MIFLSLFSFFGYLSATVIYFRASEDGFSHVDNPRDETVHFIETPADLKCAHGVIGILPSVFDRPNWDANLDFRLVEQIMKITNDKRVFARSSMKFLISSQPRPVRKIHLKAFGQTIDPTTVLTPSDTENLKTLALLNLPLTYDVVDITNADPEEIAKLPVEFFSRPNWDAQITILTILEILDILEEPVLTVAASNVRQLYTGFAYCDERRYFELYATKRIFPKEKIWRLLKSGTLECPLNRLRQLLVDMDEECLSMWIKVFRPKLKGDLDTCIAALARSFADPRSDSSEDHLFPVLLKNIIASTTKGEKNPLTIWQHSINAVADIQQGPLSNDVIKSLRILSANWLLRSIDGLQSTFHLECVLDIFSGLSPVMRDVTLDSMEKLDKVLHKLDPPKWRLMCSMKYSFTHNRCYELLCFFLGYTNHVTNPMCAELNNIGHITDLTERLNSSIAAEFFNYSGGFWLLDYVFGLDQGIRLTNPMLFERLVFGYGSTSVKFWLLYYTEGSVQIPSINYGEVANCEDPTLPHEMKLVERIIKNIHKIPSHHYAGLINILGSVIIPLVPLSDLMELLHKTKWNPIGILSQYYLDHMAELYSSSEKALDIRFFSFSPQHRPDFYRRAVATFNVFEDHDILIRFLATSLDDVSIFVALFTSLKRPVVLNDKTFVFFLDSLSASEPHLMSWLKHQCEITIDENGTEIKPIAKVIPIGTLAPCQPYNYE